MEYLNRIEQFLNTIGIPILYESLTTSILPGVMIDRTTIKVDTQGLLSVGDILHEAGHLAIIPSSFRATIRNNVDTCLMTAMADYERTHPIYISGPIGIDDVYWHAMHAGEQEAMAWSFAAAHQCQLPAHLVFHDEAYDGCGAEIADALQLGLHPGIHGLRAAGMVDSVKTFPTMTRWMQI